MRKYLLVVLFSSLLSLSAIAGNERWTRHVPENYGSVFTKFKVGDLVELESLGGLKLVSSINEDKKTLGISMHYGAYLFETTYSDVLARWTNTKERAIN